MKKKKNVPKLAKSLWEDPLFGIENQPNESFESLFASLDDEQIQDKDAQTLPKKPKTERRLRLDLHGMTLSEAETYLIEEITPAIKSNIVLKVRIITGKGKHSGPQGGILVKHIHGFVLSRFGHSIKHIDDPPYRLAEQDPPARGHFDVIFEKNKLKQ